MISPMDEVTSAPFAFDYLTREPDGPLGRFVESFWFARGTVPYTREKIAPTGSTVGVVVLGDPIVETPDDGLGTPLRAETGFLLGPHDRPVINEPAGETHAVGIVTTPIGCNAVFGLAPVSLRGRVVSLDDVWGPARSLRSDLLDADDAAAKLDLAEAVVRAGLRTGDGGLDRCERAVAALETDPTRPIGDIADELGVSHGHLDREFTRVVGLTPRALARLLRVRRLLAGIDVNGAVGWADLAYELGWFDQAHLIRDFKRHTGVTPTEYLAAQRSIYTPVEAGDAAGFVPEV